MIYIGGVDLHHEDQLAVSIQDQAPHPLADAQVAIPVVDARGGAAGRRGDPEDPPAAAAGRRRRQEDDQPPTSALLHDFHGLGLGEPLAVSAAQGLGTGDLLDRLVELPPEGDDDEDDDGASCGSR